MIGTECTVRLVFCPVLCHVSDRIQAEVGGEKSWRNNMCGSIPRILIVSFALAIVMPAIALAQSNSTESKRLPSSFLKHAVPRTAHSRDSIAAFGTTKKNGGK